MKYLSFALLALLQACGTMVVMNDSYTSKNPAFQRTFSASQARCEAAVSKSFKELGTTLQEKKGTEYMSDKWTVYEGAAVSGSRYSAVATRFEQKARLYVRVLPASKGCNVRVSRVRAWNSNVEYEKLELGFTKARVLDPFFKAMEESL